MRQMAFLIVLIIAVQVRAEAVETEDLVQRYQDLLLLTTDDYQMVDVATDGVSGPPAAAVFQGSSRCEIVFLRLQGSTGIL